MAKTTASTFDNFNFQSGAWFYEYRSSGVPVRRAMALHLTQQPTRVGSQNLWHLHLLRLKEVEVEVKVESEVEVVEVRKAGSKEFDRHKWRQKQHK